MSSPALQPACPVCGASLVDAQHWCLECGAAARTRIAPTPRRWRLIAVVLAVASVLSVIAIAVAIAKLVRSDASPVFTTTTVTGPAPLTTPAAPAATTPAAPAVTAPAAPAVRTPAAPVATTPAAPVATSPAAPAVRTPAAPVATSPARGVTAPRAP